MKTTLLLILFCIIPYQLFAQLEQGTFLIGGGLTGSIENSKVEVVWASLEPETDIVSFDIYPHLGYFILDNFALGFKGLYSYTHNEFDTGWEDPPREDYSISEYGIGPFMRYYFPFSSFAIFGDISYSFNKSIDDMSNEFVIGPDNYYKEIEHKVSSWFISPSLGIAFFATESIGIEGMIKYEYGNSNYYRKDIEADKSSEYDRYYDRLNLIIGFQIYLNFGDDN